jgi:hypothetical protein
MNTNRWDAMVSLYLFGYSLLGYAFWRSVEFLIPFIYHHVRFV